MWPVGVVRPKAGTANAAIIVLASLHARKGIMSTRQFGSTDSSMWSIGVVRLKAGLVNAAMMFSACIIHVVFTDLLSHMRAAMP